MREDRAAVKPDMLKSASLSTRGREKAMRSIRKKLMQSNWVILPAGALVLMTANASAQSLPPINLLHENPKRPLTREEREYQKQLDDAYKATIKEIPEQRANDPWAAVRPTVPAEKKQK